MDKLYYSYSDYQGSLVALTNEDGTVAERYAYDPWGVRANPDRWEERDTRTSWIVNRGYTGHEHLDAFGVIDMNGRVYDPMTALFMSPDPYVQSPSDWLNYNRYSYCLNNPFKYTDPSGEVFFLLIPAVAVFLTNMATAAALGAAIAGAFSVATTIVNGSSWDAKSFWKSVGNGAISGAITFGIGSAFGATGGAAASFANVNKGFLGISNAFLNEAGRAGAHALSQGIMSAADGGNFWAGAAAGAFGSITSHGLIAMGVDYSANAFGIIAFSTFSGGMGSVMAGGDFWEGAKSGFIVGTLNAGHDKWIRKLRNFTMSDAEKVVETTKTGTEIVEDVKSNDLVQLVMDAGSLVKGAVGDFFSVLLYGQTAYESGNAISKRLTGKSMKGTINYEGSGQQMRDGQAKMRKMREWEYFDEQRKKQAEYYNWK